MTTALLQQALDAIEEYQDVGNHSTSTCTRLAKLSCEIEKAIAQPVPVAQPIPDGWKLVPLDPTKEMWVAVNKLDDQMAAGGFDGKGCSIEQAWDCLVEAAPVAQAEPLSDSAEHYLRSKYGAYRGHHAWREIEDAFNSATLAERERCAVICDELGEHYSAYKDMALLNGDIDLSNAASGEPRAAAAIADAIRNGLYRDTSKPPIGAQE